MYCEDSIITYILYIHSHILFCFKRLVPNKTKTEHSMPDEMNFIIADNNVVN